MHTILIFLQLLFIRLETAFLELLMFFSRVKNVIYDLSRLSHLELDILYDASYPCYPFISHNHSQINRTRNIFSKQANWGQLRNLLLWVHYFHWLWWALPCHRKFVFGRRDNSQNKEKKNDIATYRTERHFISVSFLWWIL